MAATGREPLDTRKATFGVAAEAGRARTCGSERVEADEVLIGLNYLPEGAEGDRRRVSETVAAIRTLP
jgi:hypothetical protein